MSKHNLSEKSNFINLSQFLVRKKIIYFLSLKYDHTVVNKKREKKNKTFSTFLIK